MWSSFLGTKKYHNFTKEVKCHQTAAQRFMMQMKAQSFMYVNVNSLQVTDANDPDALEFVHLFLKGQSFLYNQIRKMVGSMIQVFHGMLDREII